MIHGLLRCLAICRCATFFVITTPSTYYEYRGEAPRIFLIFTYSRTFMSSPSMPGYVVNVHSLALRRAILERVSFHCRIFGTPSLLSSCRSIIRRWNSELELKKSSRPPAYLPVLSSSRRLCTLLRRKGVGVSMSTYELTLERRAVQIMPVLRRTGRELYGAL